ALTRPVADIEIPTTVQGVLAARIDRVRGEEKELLQTAAVIGREFSLGLLKQVTNEPEDVLQRRLSDLQAAEFVYEELASADIDYIFKHTLTRDVAYDSLLREKRSALHERTAEAIEALHGNRLEEHYSDLAYHYSRSGNGRKAVEYLRLAGEQAVGRSAHRE